MKVKCLWCGDIIDSKEIHNMKFCKCERTGLDYSPYWPRISFTRKDDGNVMYEVIEDV